MCDDLIKEGTGQHGFDYEIIIGKGPVLALNLDLGGYRFAKLDVCRSLIQITKL